MDDKPAFYPQRRKSFSSFISKVSKQALGYIRPYIYWLQWAGLVQSLQQVSTGWTVRWSNSGEGEIFRTLPDGPWGPPNLQYKGKWVPFPGLKRLRRRVNHSSPPSVEVKERVVMLLLRLLGLHGLFWGELHLEYSKMLICLIFLSLRHISQWLLKSFYSIL